MSSDPGVFLEGLKKIGKNLSQDTRYPDRHINVVIPQYKSTALALNILGQSR